MKAFLVYPTYLTADGSARTVGGIQTYINFLCRLLAKEGITPIVIQRSDVSFEVNDEVATVIGCVMQERNAGTNLAGFLWKAVKDRADFSKDYVIFCTDSISVPTDYTRAILIQHGVSWDIPLDLLPHNSLLRHLSVQIPILGYLRKTYQAYRYRSVFHNTRTRVCVDYNFPNWLRTQEIVSKDEGVWVIPNCVFPASDATANNPNQHCANTRGENVKVVFARRFERYRGSRLMADAVDIVCRYDSSIHFTFAGEGTDERYLESHFAGNNTVAFTRYEPEHSLAFHAGFDIAVIPSLASEGTSLAILEAMAAGCAVIATPVGGISNIVIDGFNGVYTSASAEMLASRILMLARDDVLRKELGERAVETVSVGAFSYGKWESSWVMVLDSLS